MVFRRGLALLCVVAAVTLADMGSGVDALVHKRDHEHSKETEIKYPNGAVHISTHDDKAKQEKKHHHRAKKVGADSSDDLKHVKHSQKAGATASDAKEQVIKYDHGSVRVSKPKSAPNAHVHKATTVHEVHASTRKHDHHRNKKNGDVTEDFELKEGVNEFKVAGVPLKVTVDNGKVDVDVAGKHVKSDSEVIVDTDAVEKPAKKHHKAHHKQGKKAHKKDEKAHKKGEKVHKKGEKAHKKAHKKLAPKVEEAKKVEEPTKVEETKVAATADSAARVTELATKLAKEDHGFFATQTAPIVFICGIIGALAAVVGIAAVAVVRAREQSVEDVNMQSVLADASEADIEAAVQTDAPADQSDSLDDSESDNDDDEDAEGTFANNERVGTVSV